MMKRLWLIFLFCTPAVAQDIPLETFHVPNFDCGVVTRYNPILIADNCLQWSRNVYFDEHGVTRRKGYSQFNSSVFQDEKSVRGLWGFVADDGTRYMLAISSQTIYKAPITGVFSAIPGLSGLSAVSDMDAVPYLGKIWFANGSDSMAWWDGASTKTVTEALLGSMIEGWRNRIVNAGVAGNLSSLYMSEELNGEEWTTGPTTSVAPVVIKLGGENAKPIKCLYGGYRDFLFAATEDEIYGVYGFGRNDFVVRTLSREVGCIEDKSVQEKDGALYWMSRRGIEKMTTQGSTERISDGIKDIFDTLIGNTAVGRNKIYTTQAHWEAGNLQASGPGAKISATISADSLVPSTWTHTDTDSADWNAGQFVYIDSITIPGSIQLSSQIITSPSDFHGYAIIDDFTDGNYTSNPVWTFYGANNNFMAGAPAWGDPPDVTGRLTYSAPNPSSSGNLWCSTIASHLDIMNIYMYVAAQENISTNDSALANFYFLSSTTDTANTSGYALEIINAHTGSSDNAANAYIWRIDSGVGTTIGSDSLTITGSAGGHDIVECEDITITLNSSGVSAVDSTCGLNITTNDTTYRNHKYMILHTEGHSVAATSQYIMFDNISSRSHYHGRPGIFTSKIFDTTFSTPTGGPFLFSDTVPVGSTIAYSVRQSSYNSTSGMGSWILVSTTTSGLYRIPLTQQFWQYKVDMATHTPSAIDQTPSVEYVTLQAATTGEYIHECATIDTISRWGNFQANSVLDKGTISYFVSTGTSCNSVQQATATWNAQNNNAPITISTAPFLGIKERFNIDSATQTALLRDVTVNWLEGNARPPIATAIYLNRYYMAYTTSSASGINDFVFVADKNDAPTFLDHMNCYSLVLFDRRMYCGDANSTGKIFQLEIGEDDNGEAFTSEIRTKAYSMGDSDAEKEFVKMYASFAPESESVLDINITPSYHLDLSTAPIMLSPVNTGEDSTAGMLVAKIPFATSNNITGRFIDIGFTATGTNTPWTLYGLSVYYRKLQVK